MEHPGLPDAQMGASVSGSGLTPLCRDTSTVPMLLTSWFVNITGKEFDCWPLDLKGTCVRLLTCLWFTPPSAYNNSSGPG